MNYFYIISFFISFFSIQSFAGFTNSKCNEALLGNSTIQVNRQWNPEKRVCFISVTPRKISNLKYRDYYFDNMGQFMVFNSYGEGPDSQTTGARSFFLFPLVSEYPDFSFEINGDVLIKTVSGHEFRLSGKNFSIVSLSSGAVSEKPLSSQNQGGIEISLNKGFWLDAGFRLGGLNISNPNLKTQFKSSTSSSVCSLQNKEFLNYDNSGDFTFKLNDESFSKFVKVKCSQLKIEN